MGGSGALARVGHLSLYSLLGVEEKADIGLICKQYRRRAKECHPDKNPGNLPKVDILPIILWLHFIRA